jgi:hypothetical protein
MHCSKTHMIDQWSFTIYYIKYLKWLHPSNQFYKKLLLLFDMFNFYCIKSFDQGKIKIAISSICLKSNRPYTYENNGKISFQEVETQMPIMQSNTSNSWTPKDSFHYLNSEEENIHHLIIITSHKIFAYTTQFNDEISFSYHYAYTLKDKNMILYQKQDKNEWFN